MFSRYFTAEYLKFKRTFYKKLLLLIPMFFIFIAYLCTTPRPQVFFEAMSFNWWTILVLTFSFILSSIMSDAIDKKNNKYDFMKSRGIDMACFWINKIIVSSLFVLFLSCAYLLIYWVFSLIFYGQIINLYMGMLAIFVTWISELWIVPCCLFLSYKFSWIISFILNFLGMIFGILAAPRDYWYLVPWSYPNRLLCPIMKIHPNGIPITDTNDLLLNNSVIIYGILISIIIYCALTLITSMYLKHKEGR